MKTQSTLLLTLLSVAAATLLPASGTHAQTTGTPAVLHSFTNATDGSDPEASLLLAADGNFYGVANQGGTNGTGTLYRVTPSGEFSVIHTFASATDGGFPRATLIQGTDGLLYGSTIDGGTGSGGTIFKVALDGSGFTVLHAFSNSTTGSGLGYSPYAGLVEVGGAFYGACSSGGGTSGYGTVFKMLADGTVTLIHAFTNTADGAYPYADLLLASDGKIYGSTAGGFSSTYFGNIFRVDPATDTYASITSFQGAIAPSRVYGKLLEVNDGSTSLLYGTSSSGGGSAGGTLFSVSFDGALTILQNFDSSAGSGAKPFGGLALSANGLSLFGTTTTSSASASNEIYGGLFRYDLGSGNLVSLHSFFQAEAVNSYSMLLRGADGRYYGTASTGGPNGTGGGTVYAVALDPSPGEIAFASGAVSANDDADSVSLTLKRTGGSDTAVSVLVATADGTAVVGTDYRRIAQTVEWAAGDTADKTVSIPIISRRLNDNSTRNFTVTITADSGTVLGTPAAATVTITQSPTTVQPTAQITSPPANLTLVSGTQVTIAVSLNDPSDILDNVEFFVNDIRYAKTTGKGPFAITATAPPIPGTYTIRAVATDTQGRRSTSTRTIVVVTASASNPTPTASIFSGLAGRILAGGDTVQIVAEAKSLSPDGSPLETVTFYADDTLIARFDGRGNLLEGKGQSAGRRSADATPGVSPASTANIYTANWGMPNLDKLVNLITVATSKGGRSQISAPTTVSVQATTATSNHAPRAKIANLTGGQKIGVGAEFTITATATDPDGGSAIRAASNGRRAKALSTGNIVKQIDFYLNQVKIATSTAAPYTAKITPPAAGAFVVQAIAVDDAGLSGPATPVTIQATATPTLNLALPGIEGNKVSRLEGSGVLKVRVVRSGDTSAPLTVAYKAKGGNVQGVDINQLKGSLTIPAGAAAGRIKVRFLNDGVLDGNKILKLRLVPSTDGSYSLGTPSQVKIRVIDLQGVDQ